MGGKLHRTHLLFEFLPSRIIRLVPQHLRREYHETPLSSRRVCKSGPGDGRYDLTEHKRAEYLLLQLDLVWQGAFGKHAGYQEKYTIKKMYFRRRQTKCTILQIFFWKTLSIIHCVVVVIFAIVSCNFCCSRIDF